MLADHWKGEGGQPFSCPLIIHDTTRCLDKVPQSLAVLVPLSSKNAKVKLNPEKEDFKRKDKGSRYALIIICSWLENQWPLMPECMSAFGVKSVTVTMWTGKLAFLNSYLLFVVWASILWHSGKSPLSHNVRLSKKLRFRSFMCKTLLKKSAGA